MTVTTPAHHSPSRLPPFDALVHSIVFEIVTKSRSAHNGLLASKLGKKVSANLGAIQGRCVGFNQTIDCCSGNYIVAFVKTE